MKVATPKGKQKINSICPKPHLLFCLYPWWMTKLKIMKQSGEWQTENHETKWSEKEAGACWSYFANVQPRSTEKTSGHKKGVASDENSLYMVSFPLVRRVPMRSPSLSWEWSLHGLLPSHEKGPYAVSFPLMRRVPTQSPSLSWEGSLRSLLPSHENGLYMVSFPVMRRVSCLHKSGFWSPQRVGLSQEWSLVSTEGWPLVSTEGWPLVTVVFHQGLHCIVTVQSSSNT